MKKSIIILLCFIFTSCGLAPDRIKLSQKEVHFTSEKSSIWIATATNYWWFGGIRFNNEYLKLQHSPTQKECIIKHEEFTIIRENGKNIYIYMTKNTTNKIRTLQIGLQDGDFFDGIDVIQDASQ